MNLLPPLLLSIHIPCGYRVELYTCLFTLISASKLPEGHGLKTSPFGNPVSKDLSAQTQDSCGFSVILKPKTTYLEKQKYCLSLGDKLYSVPLKLSHVFQNARVMFCFGYIYVFFLVSCLSEKRPSWGEIKPCVTHRGQRGRVFPLKGQQSQDSHFPYGLLFVCNRVEGKIRS